MSVNFLHPPGPGVTLLSILTSSVRCSISSYTYTGRCSTSVVQRGLRILRTLNIVISSSFRTSKGYNLTIRRVVLWPPILMCTAWTKLSFPVMSFSMTANLHCNLDLSSWTITISLILMACLLCLEEILLNSLKEVKYYLPSHPKLLDKLSTFVNLPSHVVAIKV